MPGMVKLLVYIQEDCWTCNESRRIVAEIAPQFSQLAVELVNIEEPNRPDEVFAVPTYILDGHVISLGNPYRDELRRKIKTALNQTPK
jgi:hypothetical protein